MRPTIPLAAWRIAVDLDATRLIRRQMGHPAEGCTCQDYTIWRTASASAFPQALDEALQRLGGIEKDRPTDLYVFGGTAPTVDFRVMYHIAGRILSGPAPWVDHGEKSRMHNYHSVRSKPAWIGLRVCTTRDSFECAPQLPKDSQSRVLCVDFRLQVDLRRAL